MGVETRAPVRLCRRRGLGRGRPGVRRAGGACLPERTVERHPRGDHAAIGRWSRRAADRRRRAPAVTELDALPYPDFSDFFDQFERSRFGRNGSPACSWRRRAAAGGASGCTARSAVSTAPPWRFAASPRRARSPSCTHLATTHPGCDIQVVDNILDLKYFKTLLPELAERKLSDLAVLRNEVEPEEGTGAPAARRRGDDHSAGHRGFSDKVLKQMKKGVSGAPERPAPEVVQGDRHHADLVTSWSDSRGNRQRTTSRWRTCRRVCASAESRPGST
mgnify:CR=1 FL=1